MRLERPAAKCGCAAGLCCRGLQRRRNRRLVPLKVASVADEYEFALCRRGAFRTCFCEKCTDEKDDDKHSFSINKYQV